MKKEKHKEKGDQEKGCVKRRTKNFVLEAE